MTRRERRARAERRAAERALAREVMQRRDAAILQFRERGRTIRELAAAFKLSHTRIWHIVRGQ